MKLSRYSARRSLLFGPALLSAVIFTHQARADDGLADALTGGTVSLELRPRYEVVSQDGKARASLGSLRTLLGYDTKSYDGLDAMLQFSDVAPLGSGYNSGTNGKTGYASILDPRAANVNQAFAHFSGIPDTDLKAGRQIIQLDDQRFVGNVDFRQTMQTFDAISLVNRSLPDVTLFAAYLWGIKDILNQYVPARTTLAEASYAPVKGLKLQAFGTWYGNETPNNQAPIAGAAACGLSGAQACNEATYGARLTGSLALGDQWGADYHGTLARQRSYEGGSGLIDAGFSHAGGRITWQDAYLGLDRMDLGSHDGLYGFQTPLATKHAFNGWAEEFLTTPKQGLTSLYATAGAKPLGVDLQAVYYRFTSDTGGLTFGHETDLSAGYAVTPHVTVSLQGAIFRSDNSGYKNTKAGWLFATIRY